MSEEDTNRECDEDYLTAIYFLNNLTDSYVNAISTDILFNNWYGKKYYKGLKHFLELLDLFSGNSYKAPVKYYDCDFGYFTYFQLLLTFDYLGYPEMSTELCRILSIYHYNKENYDKGGSEDLGFKVELFYDYYLDYAKKSNDQKAYYNALKNMKYITHA